jgi:two-component system sensor histidine kinase MprB
VSGPSADARAAAARLGRAWARLDAWGRDLSLRWRLTVATAITVVLALGIALGVSYVAVRHELFGQINGQLVRQSADAALAVRAEPNPGGGVQLELPKVPQRVGEIRGWRQIFNAHGHSGDRLPISGADLTVANGHHPAITEMGTYDGLPVMIRTSALPHLHGVGLQVAIPIGSQVGQLRRLAAAFALLGLLALLVVSGVAWLMSQRALAPVGELTATAEEIAETRNLSRRIGDARGDEIGRLAASFNRMLEALASSIDAQRQLVADASHELRTPLASLRTNVEVLGQLDRLSPESRQEILSEIVSQTEELTALVSDVVELARGDEPPGQLEEVSLAQVVGHAVRRARRNWPATTFSTSLTPVTVPGVAARLDRAVTNLLDNAAKFSGPGGQVRVTLTADGRLSVHDSGPGVPEEALPHVFERFFRAAEARGLPGSGLGLAIVRQTAASHGGTVTLRNAPEGGAVVEFTIPPAWEPEALLPVPERGTRPVSVR